MGVAGVGGRSGIDFWMIKLVYQLHDGVYARNGVRTTEMHLHEQRPVKDMRNEDLCQCYQNFRNTWQ